MARIKLPLKGQTANKSADGQCRAIVNMRPTREAAYVPVTPRRKLRNLNRNYTHLFVHKTSTHEHWIGIVDHKIYVNVEESGEILFQTPESVNSIEQLGNSIALICDSTINYLLWVDEEYRFLGELPELPAYEISIVETEKQLTLNEADGFGSHWEDINIDRVHERVKNAVSVAQRLIVEGGTDERGDTHSANGQHLFDAHILQYAYRLFDGTLVKYSPPILLMPKRQISNLKIGTIWPSTGKDWKVYVAGFKPTLTTDTEWYNPKWEGVIKSVDFFISPALNLSSMENMADEPDLEGKGSQVRYELVTRDKDRDMQNINNCGTLYFLKSVPYTSEASAEPVSFENEKSIENISYNELLPVDTGSNHIVGGKSSCVYNSRLHIGNVKTTMYKGHSARSFLYVGKYNDRKSLTQQISGLRPAYQWGKMTYHIITTLKIDGKEETVISTYETQTAIEHSFTAMLSYPDVRATRMRIIGESENIGQVLVCDVPLAEHKYLNMSYYLDGNLDPIGFKYSMSDIAIPESKGIISYEPNKLKVSSINNPFNYPNVNNYQIGNGEIISMGTQAQRISEGSFGQYPLFIFTNTGIYSLQIGQGEILYSNQVAPVTYETPVSKIISETPYGIIFISARGLCSISGQQVELISESIDQIHNYMMIYANQIPESAYPDKEFTDYLAGVEAIIYNPYHDEVIIVSADTGYSYVFHIPSKTFWISTEEIRMQVRNTFPELYVHGEKSLKAMKESREKSTRVAIISHPIDFGTPDIKKMQRAYLRALLHNANIGEIGADTPAKMLVNLYSSLDGVNFNLARGLLLQQDGSYKDIDLGLMARTRSKYYMIGIAGTISEGSRIEYMEFETAEAYNNEKMR